MNCFYHHSSAAVGICRACGRALCPECAGSPDRALACEGRCEAEVQKIWDSRAAKSRALAGYSVFLIVTGLILAAWGFGLTGTFDFMVNLGVCFVIAGLFLFMRGRVK